MYKLSHFNLIVAGAALAGLTACTLDSIIVLKHPASVQKGETFAVGAVDIILDVGSASQPADSIHRDSIHVGVGLPAGWQVLSAKACPAPHFRPARASVNGLDTNVRNKLILDTLAACEGRATALAEDPGVKEFLKGRTIRTNASPDSLGRPFNVKTDTVPQWFGFAGRIDISVPAGAAADTVVDTTAFKALPVYIYLSLKAPERDTSVRLLFFSKTGKLDTSAFSNSSNQDRGALVYRPVIVGSPVPVVFRGAAAPRPLTISPSAAGRWIIGLPASGALGASSRASMALEIRSSTGTLLRAWPGSAWHGLGGGLAWDGKDGAGKALPAGRYLLVLRDASGSSARTFPLLP